MTDYRAANFCMVFDRRRAHRTVTNQRAGNAKVIAVPRHRVVATTGVSEKPNDLAVRDP